MADIKGSAATVVTPTDATRFLVSHTGLDRVASGALLRDYLGNTRTNLSTADQAVGASATAYLAGSGIVIPAAGLRVGSQFWWRIVMSKTAAATAAMSFLLKLGANGTTADTTAVTMTLGAQTAVADVAIVEITAVVRALAAAAAGNIIAACDLRHNLSATGFATVPVNAVIGTNAAIATNAAAGQTMGLALTTGASHSLTISQVQAVASNL